MRKMFKTMTCFALILFEILRKYRQNIFCVCETQNEKAAKQTTDIKTPLPLFKIKDLLCLLLTLKILISDLCCWSHKLCLVRCFYRCTDEFSQNFTRSED